MPTKLNIFFSINKYKTIPIEIEEIITLINNVKIDVLKEYFSLANEVKGHPYLKKFSNLAKKLNVVLPISFFERDKNSYFNSVMIIDAMAKLKAYIESLTYLIALVMKKNFISAVVI